MLGTSMADFESKETDELKQTLRLLLMGEISIKPFVDHQEEDIDVDKYAEQ